MANHTVNPKTYRIESSYKLRSDWLPASAFTEIEFVGDITFDKGDEAGALAYAKVVLQRR